MPAVVLKPNREKSLLRRHPWVFSGAIAKADAQLRPGDTVEILDASGRWLARGAYSPASQIRVRVWTFNDQEEITPEFFKGRLERALALRSSLGTVFQTGATRLVNAEADGLPGLTVDFYADYLVCQFTTAGCEVWRDVIVTQLEQLLPVAGIFERSDVDVRKKEGLEARVGVLAGRPPPEFVEICESSRRYLVDIVHGHKTGFYLDQRENRSRVAQFAPGQEVLDCFAYTGGFAIACLRGGAARVTLVEASGSALQFARRNVELNGIAADRAVSIEGDVFTVLRKFRDRGQKFDMIILDPPRFMETRSQLHRAARAYKDINLLAFKLLRPGGTLFTFSCSGLLEVALFQKIVADAALDARREVRILEHLYQAADHVVALNFPESAYLKGLLCRVL